VRNFGSGIYSHCLNNLRKHRLERVEHRPTGAPEYRGGSEAPTTRRTDVATDPESPGDLALGDPVRRQRRTRVQSIAPRTLARPPRSPNRRRRPCSRTDTKMAQLSVPRGGSGLGPWRHLLEEDTGYPEVGVGVGVGGASAAAMRSALLVAKVACA
jgi:hypothetical protein